MVNDAAMQSGYRALRVLVTGAAGFIGAACCARLLEAGSDVIGIDNLNDYYAVRLKQDRLLRIQDQARFMFVKGDLTEPATVENLFRSEAPQRVLHLAAQPGVRYSLENPGAYIASNLVAFGNLLEGCRHHGVEHLVYASSSSVYGANKVVPFSEQHRVDQPLSLYGATKKANELMAHSYSHLYSLPTTGLRFFTVYGPWGRPDMSPMRFADRIVRGEAIDVYNHGNHRRDFTYIDDIVEGVMRCLDCVPGAPENASPRTGEVVPEAPYRVYNIGSHKPVDLLAFIELLEKAFGREVPKRMLPMQPGDMEETYADVSALMDAVGYAPQTTIAQGVDRFAAWYKAYHGVG